MNTIITKKEQKTLRHYVGNDSVFMNLKQTWDRRKRAPKRETGIGWDSLPVRMVHITRGSETRDDAGNGNGCELVTRTGSKHSANA